MSELARRAYSVQELANIWGHPAGEIDRLVMSGRMRSFCIGNSPSMIRVPVAEAERVHEIIKAGDEPSEVAPPVEFTRRPRKKKEPPAPKGPVPTVYFVDCGPYTKIGFTQSGVRKRLAELRTANPFPMVVWALVPGGVEVEKALHKHFASSHHSLEWFRLKHRRDEVKTEIRRLGGEILKRPLYV